MQRPIILAVFLFLVAFVPLAIPSDAMQIDEVAHWYDRTDRFLRAMRDGRFADTVQTEHPGITTVGFGGIGRMVSNVIDPKTELPFITQIQLMRVPVNVVNALVIPFAFLIMVRLFDLRLAFLAALMWATAPYLRWYSRLLHIDGMSTSFMALSLVLMLFAWQVHIPRNDAPATVRWWWIVLAGFIAGLATLTRFSSVYMFGIAGILALINWFYYRHAINLRLFVQRIAAPVIVFMAVLLLTWTALYPGMWTNADAILGEFTHGFDNALNPHSNGSYFMGEPTPDPGFWYYFVSVPYRMTPWALLGLPLALIAAFRGALRSQWRLWLAVFLYAAIYIAILVWQGKKFDRYALPTFPALHLMAAFGWLWLVDVLPLRKIPHRIAWAAVTIALIANSMWYLRTEYAYMNPLLGGGGDHAEYMLIIGSGEGMDGVAAFFQAMDEETRCNTRIATFYPTMFKRYIPCMSAGGIDADDFTQDMDYIVNYINYRQRYTEFQPLFESATPVYTYEVHGVTYAEIYDTAQFR